MNKNHRSVAVRVAASEELSSIMTVIDSALLATDAATVRTQIHTQDVLVAVADSSILGVVVLDENHIDAIAVRRRQRGNGIGTALIEAASEHCGPLIANFRPSVSPFYESLGFEIERTSETRWQGFRPAVR